MSFFNLTNYTATADMGVILSMPNGVTNGLAWSFVTLALFIVVVFAMYRSRREHSIAVAGLLCSIVSVLLAAIGLVEPILSGIYLAIGLVAWGVAGFE